MSAVLEREYTIKEVAKILRINADTVNRRILAGKLRARKEGRDWRISESNLNAYIASTYPQDIQPEEPQKE